MEAMGPNPALAYDSHGKRANPMSLYGIENNHEYNAFLKCI